MSIRPRTSVPNSDIVARIPQLPAELRLKIWRHAIPRRVLQLGVDVPYPFLRKPPPSTTPLPRYIDPDSAEFALLSIPVLQPSIFYACHDSRAVCLEEFIPFGYTFMHPTDDTLYISRRAMKALDANLTIGRAGARPPLYPIALLDRIAMEFDRSDLPHELPWHSVLQSRPLLILLLVCVWFGAAKELLIVQAKKGNRPIPFNHWHARKAHINLEITDIDPATSCPAGELDELTEYVQNNMTGFRGPWYQRQVPKVKCVGMRMDATVETQCSTLKKFLPIGDRVAANWHREMFEFIGMDCDWDAHGNSFYPEYMERILARYKEKLRAAAS
ncbi:hypothetical protein DL98DRAFT_595683 [Cadophora sp. DSE1049]|nr:hypothetical protein DL98DRAFT_595683 [Cadophora sp. DSE1049]